MPIYEYECQACGEELEAWQKISDEPLKKCPACGKMKLQKLISAAGFRLKGGGWYETDFKSSGKKNLAGDQKSGKSSGESKAKPADKKGSKDTGAAA
ncbi:MAG TPA: zinc ribbon domain-containing protein [Gammaproteobacteria bacterium]|nr:zinc ribbon domain-containing protein [Gammaproteobacteria bacterium]